MPGGMHFNYMDQLVTGQKQGLAMIYGERAEPGDDALAQQYLSRMVLHDGCRAHHYRLSAARPLQAARGGA